MSKLPIRKEDVVSVVKSIDVTLSDSEIKVVLERYPSQQLQEPDTNWSYIVESKDMKIQDKVIRYPKVMYLIEEATDMKTAMGAISIARVTGSVGATSTTQKPDGTILKYAKVSRIEFVQPK